MFNTNGIKFLDGRVLNRLDSGPYKPFDTGWRTILGFLIQFLVVNLSILHNSCLSILWLCHWLYQWIMIQFLLFGGQTFLWIASAVMNFEQCIYKNSSFYDVMFDMMELLTPTFQNVTSPIRTGLASCHVQYSKAPRQGICWWHRTQPPNCTSGWHGRTHSKIGMRQCIGANGNW